MVFRRATRLFQRGGKRRGAAASVVHALAFYRSVVDQGGVCVLCGLTYGRIYGFLTYLHEQHDTEILFLCCTNAC